MAEQVTWLVARREIREATRTTSFRVSLAISAVALAAIIVLANLNGDDSPSRDVVVAGADAAERAAAIEQLDAAAGVAIEVRTVPDDDAARAAVDEGDADVAVSADGTRLTTREPVDLDSDAELPRLVNVLRSSLALDQGLRAAGLTPEQAADVRATPPLEVESVRDEDPDEIDSGRIVTATITNILLFVMLQMYGQWVLTGVTREKASRVVEVLLAMITVRQLLIGKVVGIGIVALMHAAVLIVTAFVTTRIVGVELTEGIGLGDLALAGVWFLLGYGLYCGAYAAAGSLVSRVEDAQDVAFPVMLPLLLGYLASFSAAGGANALLWVLAFFPPTAIVAMPALYAVGEASWWMVLVSMGLTVIAIVLVAALAARIYARSVLQSGKRVKLRSALGRSEDTELSGREPAAV